MSAEKNDDNEDFVEDEGLPVALRNTQITDADVEAMLRVARGMTESGHYLRTPKKIEEAKRVDNG